MTPSSKCVDLIKSFEGCSLVSYQDSKGIWTIGFGATGSNIVPGLTWSQGQADAALYSTIADISKRMLYKVPTDHSATFCQDDMTQGQLDALTCFAYNVGLGGLENSTLFKLYLNGSLLEAANEFEKWDHAGNVLSAGLLRRRLAEKALFLS